MPAPTNPIITWATKDLDPRGRPLKVLPPIEISDTGLLSGTPMGREWFNYILNNFSEWLQYLSAPTAKSVVGDNGEYECVITAKPMSKAPTGWTTIDTITCDGGTKLTVLKRKVA